MSDNATPRKLSRRRLLLSGAALASVAAIAQACSQATPTPAPQKPAEPKPAGQAAQPTAPAAAAKPAAAAGEVRWQFRGSDADLKAAQEFLTQSFGKSHPNIKVSVEPAPDGRDEKLIAAMVGGNAPDVFESWTDNVTQYADRGQVMDVEPLAKRDYSAEEIKDFYAWQWRDLVLPSGLRFGVPKYVNVMFTWINRDAFEKAGVEVPKKDWTHEDYAAAATKLTTRKGDQVDQWGLFYPVWSWDRFWYKIEAWGGKVVDPNDRTKALFGEEKALEAFEWVRKLMWDDKTMAQRLLLAPQGQSFNTQQLFASGKFAMVEDGFYPFSMARNIDKKIKWQYVHTPKGPVTRRVLGTTDAFVGWKGTKNPDAAWELLKFLGGKDYQINQTKSTGLLPIRHSVLAEWKKICVQTFPELEQVNLDVGPQAMEEGYPGNRILFTKDAEARKIMVPALEKVYIVGNTPVTYFKQIAEEISAKMK